MYTGKFGKPVMYYYIKWLFCFYIFPSWLFFIQVVNTIYINNKKHTNSWSEYLINYFKKSNKTWNFFEYIYWSNKEGNESHLSVSVDYHHSMTKVRVYLNTACNMANGKTKSISFFKDRKYRCISHCETGLIDSQSNCIKVTGSDIKLCRLKAIHTWSNHLTYFHDNRRH